jgi:protein-disulfide isomerase
MVNSRLNVHATGLCLVLLAGCSTSAQPAHPPAAGDIVATVGRVSITLSEVDERALQMSAASFGNLKLSQALFEARRTALDEIIGDALLDQEAKARGVDRAKLAEQEVASKAAAVTDADVTAWYQANPSRVQGAPLDQVRSPIKALLIQERTRAAREQYLETLKAKTPVKVMLEPPRQTVAEAGRPARGPINAPIEMIEFSDFQCPYCLRASPIVTQVLNAYGDRIRFVYRHYPLPNHPNAWPAAEASQCANEQGKFWPYHDKLFASEGRLSDADLRRSAAEVGVDPAKFGACLDAHRFKADVDADIAAGDEAGVSGTPAFFINGRVLTGAQPFDAFKRVIDDELARKQSR